MSRRSSILFLILAFSFVEVFGHNEGDNIHQTLERNIKTYNDVYFKYNTICANEHATLLGAVRSDRIVVTGLILRTTDAPQATDEFELFTTTTPNVPQATDEFELFTTKTQHVDVGRSENMGLPLNMKSVHADPLRNEMANLPEISDDFEVFEKSIKQINDVKFEPHHVMNLKTKMTDAPENTNEFAFVEREDNSVKKTQQLQYPVNSSTNDVSDKLWFDFVQSLEKNVPHSKAPFLKGWTTMLRLMSNDTLFEFTSTFKPMPLRNSLMKMSSTDTFLKLFWPFIFSVGVMNQRLALYGLSRKMDVTNVKSTFYNELEKHQNIQMPVMEHRVVYSFNDSALVDGISRAGLLENSNSFVKKHQHLFTADERNAISLKVDAAFELINKTSPQLYKAINQLVACIGFYKSEIPGHLGGTVSSALGVIWLDPSAAYNWSIPFYAEQIIHEYIHTALFYAELVHGTYTDHTKLSNAKVVSAIRRQLRDYDKSFHAAYVATGLVTFHTRAGFLNRAVHIATPLWQSLNELIAVNKREHILDKSGEAMLQSMTDLMYLKRIMH